jgi:PAS domain S-box-containing protein
MPLWTRYILTSVIVVACFAARDALDLAPGTLPFLLFFPGILLTSFVFDRGSGVFATLLAALLSLYFFIPPVGSLDISGAETALSLSLFVATGLLIAALIEALRATVDQLTERTEELERTRAEFADNSALLDAMLEGTTDLIYAKDRQGRFVRVNEPSARLLGAPAAAVVGKRDRDFLAPAEADVIERTDEEVMSSGKTHSLEETVSPPDGTPHVYLSTKSPWRNAAGEIVGLIGISRDISERRRTEDALRTSDNQRKLLLADINHRVKNHLQSVAGLLDVAARRSETLADARAALEAGASRLGVLGRVYTRLHLADNATVISMRGFIETLCADLKASLISENAIAVRVEAANVELDSSRAVLVGLIVNELVQNALKYAFPDDRAGTVCVFFELEGGSFRLTVHDNGVGMPDSARRGSGTRLVRALAQQLGGTIEWRGPPGTDVTIRFPAADPATRL